MHVKIAMTYVKLVELCPSGRILLFSFSPSKKMEIDEYLGLFSDSLTNDEEDLEEGFEVEVVSEEYVSDNEEIQPHFGGYDYEFVDEVLPSQKCPVCLLPMKNPVQTSECGHRFCRDCLQRILRNSTHPICPNDRREIEEEGGFFADKAWARDILSLRVKCPQSSRGCEWIGQLRHAEEHQEECPYEDTPCSACQGRTQRRLLEAHFNDECPNRIVECIYCEDEFFFVEKQEHEDIYCKRFPLACKNDCGHDEIPREEMAHHVSEKCLMTVVQCPYSEAGCPFEDKRAYLNDHIEASVDEHLQMTWNSLVSTKKELSTMADKFHEVQEVNQMMAESVADCRIQIRELVLTVKKQGMEIVQQKKFNQEITIELKNVKGRTPRQEIRKPVYRMLDEYRLRNLNIPDSVPHRAALQDEQS